MKKYLLDLRVKSVEQIHQRYVLIKLTDDKPLPEMLPGQFVEIRVDGSPNTFLRRPISINFVDTEANELWLLVAAVGDGTRKLAQLKLGDMLNCLLPLGNGFTMPKSSEERILLVGGGVGVAPLLYMGAQMAKMGCKPTFLLGARTAKDLLMLDIFKRYGRVCVTTEDGSEGEKGFVTNHSLLEKESFDRIATCGPTPMMMLVRLRQSVRLRWRISWLVVLELVSVVWKRPQKEICVFVRMDQCLIFGSCYGKTKCKDKGSGTEESCNDSIRHLWLWA